MKSIILLCFFLFGCTSAKIVSTTISPVGGVAQYHNGLYVRDKSRELAIKEIDNFCKSPYKIIKEEFNPDVFSIVISGIHYTNNKDDYMYIQFECLK